MGRLFRCLLILLALGWGAQSLLGASAEDRAFNTAEKKFQSGFWELAEKDFAAFAARFTNSARLPQAILYQAQSQFQLRQFRSAVDLLEAHQHRSGSLADQYLFWTGLAQFENTNFTAAAAAFGQVAEKFPASALRLESAVRRADALARLADWPEIVALLQNSAGVFQSAVRARATNEWIGLGWLQLGGAQLEVKNFAGAQSALDALEKLSLNPDLAWQRQYLKCRLLAAQGRGDQALGISTNLLSSANPAHRAEAVAFQAQLLEQTGRVQEAIETYRENLAGGVPVKQQRQALLRIADLNLRQNQIGAAVETLQNFLSRFPDSGAADLALLTLGELHLKQATQAAGGPDTNLLQQATTNFDQLLGAFTNSPLAGKALLDKGWCLWTGGQIAQSARVFEQAAQKLPPSPQQAEARFKWADAQYQLKDFAGAVTNYQFIVENDSALPEVRDQLLEPALYQLVRAALDARELNVATNAVGKLLDWYPEGFAADRALLLAGEGFVHHNDPARARQLFAEVEKRLSNSPLLSEIRLAIARSYEQERNWDAAITNYQAWLAAYPKASARPRAEFSRAWDEYMAGRETNALNLFTNFVAQFPTQRLAQRARWWIGDFYFRQGDFLDAENNYQLVFKSTNWPASDLSYQAQMMAGRSAVARLSYRQAITYFTNLASDLNCPADLRAQATFAYGDAEVLLSPDPGQTNKLANLQAALGIFQTLPQNFPTNRLVPLAWGRIGDCYLQLGEYDEATNAYRQAMDSPLATADVRGRARVSLGAAAEQLAQQQSGPAQTARLKEALDDYLDVFYDRDLRQSGRPDWLFWTKKAGLEAGRVAETLQEWPQAQKVYEEIADLFPVLRPAMQRRIQKVQEHSIAATGQP